MEQATIPRPGPKAPRTPSQPPGSRAPGPIQALRYTRDPLGFLTEAQRRHGDIFTITFPYFGRVVYVTHPDLVKQVFTGSPA